MEYPQVHDHLNRRPFEPLLVRMVGGTEYRLTTPENLVSPYYAVFLLAGGVFATVAIEHIEEIRPLKDGARGKRRKPRRQRR